MKPTPPLDERPVTSLRGVGPSLAATLERLGLRTVQDLLFHLPLRYEDRTRVVPIGTLRTGDRAVIEGEMQLAEVVFRKRRALLCRITDGSGFPGQSEFKKLIVGGILSAMGNKPFCQ